MANEDYKKKGNGAFASSVALDAPLGPFDTSFTFTRSRLSRPDAIHVGMAAMVSDEIMRVDAINGSTITVRRGCADTVPAAQPVDSVVWLFDASTTGSDRVERSAGEVVAVKTSPFTIGGGGMLPARIPPDDVTFNWRVFRPYPPAHVMVDNQRFNVPAVLDDTNDGMHITWFHRDRVLQADQLVGHDDASIGPEPGVTYTFRMYHPITHAVARIEEGIIGNEFTYRRAQALYDMGMPTEVLTPICTLTSSRDGFEAWQFYSMSVEVHPSDTPLPANVMSFSQAVIETPYAVNVRYAVADPTTDHVLAVAARPVDRMADKYELFVDDIAAGSGQVAFTPWVASDFRLPELETIVNVRSSSLYDGVSLVGVQVGQLALIDSEIVQVAAISGSQITVKRGCLDTVPAVHIAGSLLWFFEASASFDAAAHADGATPAYKLRPVSYSTPYALNTLPALAITMSGRAKLPYAPGRIVVNGRPWFEEAQAISGSAVAFSWARRNRLTTAGGVVAHADPDQVPEDGQVVALTFYYETPPANSGDPAVQNVLRNVDVAATGYMYPYSLAQADGLAAGNALGVCGTVVIYCRIEAKVGALRSLQSYVVPIRVPSYPC
jgi:hypothetical protein